ncbi:MAG: nucleotidyltransferase family protein [Sphingomonadaceae bacterium]|uniref:nucleotidyltransferase family protein n=1 Tax=Thermaurantiacus sp. TaxID=2820283 RepID=UPI00298EE053|nr:nucleotidyltransferase family protein [Thermaurantiacus sp.]MCS6986412.1 nucleotidyltransferase family protein [Sphingomonadaceae bacterium]MDW8414327.1 nucleotidyltransferase family protein [Thermaurantiacus sp.]
MATAVRPLAPPAPAGPAAAMVLAAGLGRRMRPLTATRPKPLVEVAGRSLLDRALDVLRRGGVRRAVVNVHYLADRVEAHLAHRDTGLEVRISDERDQLMDTGGGIARALPLIACDPFLAINADNLWAEGPVPAVRQLAERWDDAVMDALLLVVPLARAYCHQGSGDFRMDAMGRLGRRVPGRVAPFVFTGLQMLSARLFANAPQGPFSMNLLWDRAAARGRLFGVAYQGLWFDVGTAAAVARAETLLGRL